MYRKIQILLFLLFIYQNVKAQQNFQKIYLFEDTFAIFNDVYVTDSCYYYTCTSGKAYQREFFNFGKINFNGTENILLLDSDITSLQRVMFSRSDMDTNFRGNFVTCFTNSSAQGTVPRIKEVNKNGILISDYTLNDYWLNDSLYFNTFNRMIINNSDSTYLLYNYCYDYTSDDNSSMNGATGTKLTKLKFDGSIVWEKNFQFMPIGINKPAWGVLNFLSLPNSHFLLIIGEMKFYSPSQAELDWTKIHFIEIDVDGNELNHNTFQDGQYCPGFYASKLLTDGSIIISYYESILGGTPPNGDYFKPRPVIARLDNNYDLIWKKELREFYGTDYSFYSNFNDLKLVGDSLFVGAFQYVEELVFNVNYKNVLRVAQYNIDGVNKWNRDYVYFPVDNFNDPEYGIYDFELASDGGYIMVGEIYHYDSLSTGAPGQYGYVLKTNCLGFLGDPQAEFGYSSSIGEVTFTNESIQAGSYTWIFGDGDTLNTSEYIDTLLHNYLSNGNYTVKLIAFGCNGMNDTISKTITVSGVTNGYAGDGTLLTLYPNPVVQGESVAIYVGKIPSDNIKVEIISGNGDLVFKGNIDLAQSTYIIPINLASGIYFVSLVSDGERLEVEKLVVE